MIKLNQCAEEEIIREILADGAEGFEIMTFGQLMQLAETYNEAGERLRSNVMQRVVTGLLQKVGDKRIDWQGSRHTVWVLSNIEYWGKAELSKSTKYKIRDIFDENEKRLPAPGAADFSGNVAI